MNFCARIGQDRTGQDRTGQDRTGQAITAPCGGSLKFIFKFIFSFSLKLKHLRALKALKTFHKNSSRLNSLEIFARA